MDFRNKELQTKSTTMATSIQASDTLDYHNYTESEIIELGMRPVANHSMDYLVYEKENKAYFFEPIGEELFRLFIITSRQSFYLS